MSLVAAGDRTGTGGITARVVLPLVVIVVVLVALVLGLPRVMAAEPRGKVVGMFWGVVVLLLILCAAWLLAGRGHSYLAGRKHEGIAPAVRTQNYGAVDVEIVS
jgi:hypothetical protein